ncbi:hypothetical protein Tco_0218013 [Tanacetum coccineum]
MASWPTAGCLKGGLSHSELSNGELANSGLLKRRVVSQRVVEWRVGQQRNTMAEQNVRSTSYQEQMSNISGHPEKYKLASKHSTAQANVPAIILQQFWKTMSKGISDTPCNNTSSPFELPPSGDTVIDFVNELGYPKPVEIDKNFWQADMGRVYSRDPDIFLTQSKPQASSEENQRRKYPPLLIPMDGFQSDIYFYYLAEITKHPSTNLEESASYAICNKASATPKATTTTPVKQTKPAPPPSKKPSKLIKEEVNDPDLRWLEVEFGNTLRKREGEGDDADLERAIKLSLDPAFLPHGRAPVGGVTIRDPVSEATPKLHEVVGKGKAVVTEEQVAHSLIDLSKKKRTTDQFILIRRDQTPPDSTTGPSSQPEDYTSEKEIHESSSTSDSERTESDTETAAPKAHEALAGPDPEPMKEDQTGSDSGKLHVSLAGPNPEHMDDEFLATAYPKVHENLKLITDERVIDDKPESHSGSMSIWNG